MKKLNLIGLILFLFVGFVGCDKTTDSEKPCLHLNSKNIDKTIPIINNYLSSLKSNLNDEQKLQALTE